MSYFPITSLIGVLFLVVAGALIYGAHAFGKRPADDQSMTGPRVDMGREVIWTAVAAMLLLAVFAYAR